MVTTFAATVHAPDAEMITALPAFVVAVTVNVEL